MADIEMTPSSTLKRSLQVKETPVAKAGKGKGRGSGFQIRVTGRTHDGDLPVNIVDVTSGMTLAQLKEVLLEPISHEYQFEPGFYRGQQEVMSEQITM